MSSTSILIVEDERIIAKGIEKQLKSMGYVVVGLAATGEEAVVKAIQLQPHLILMDIHLGPGMDGVDAAALIQQQAHLPVVFLTAHSDDATLHRAKLTEPFGYVLKPYQDKDLHTAIEIGLYRHKMENRLRENEQWLAATLGSIGDGVIATDDLGRIRFVNALAEKLTGWTPLQALGQDLPAVFHIVDERTRLPVPNPVGEVMATGKNAVLNHSTMLLDKSGKERPIDCCAAPIRHVSGNLSGAVLIFRDISERRRLEDQLRQAQKMEAIGRMAGGIAHDFNNITTTIIGAGEILQNETQSEIRTELLRQIVYAGERAASLTKQFLAFSQQQILRPRVINLNSVVRDIALVVRRHLGSNIQFNLNLVANLGHIKADPTQIGQVILNLAANAQEAMSAGGQLTITTDTVEVDDATISQSHEMRPGQYAMLTVSDTGAGMSDETMKRIFEPFFTTKEMGQGVGLGLATVYGIVKQSGGHLEVNSKLQQGTTFRVYLPLSLESSTPTPSASRPVVKGTETILLVEDEETVRLITGRMLAQSGYTVLEAANGLDALKVAEVHEGPIHLLLSDLIMPYLYGRQLAALLLRRMPAMRVLFMTGYAEEELMPQLLESTQVHYLHKPFNRALLTSKVREVLDRRESV